MEIKRIKTNQKFDLNLLKKPIIIDYKMSPEYKLAVSFTAKNEQEADRIRDAISLLKGVKSALWSEVPVVPANELETFGLLLDELKAPPPIITGSWIRSKLPELSKYDLRDWVNKGIVQPAIPYSGRGPRQFTAEEARKIGTIWYLRTMKIPPTTAISHTELFHTP